MKALPIKALVLLTTCFSLFAPLSAINAIHPRTYKEEVVVSDTISYKIEKRINLPVPKALQKKNKALSKPYVNKGASQFQEIGITTQTASRVVGRRLLQANMILTASVPINSTENGDIIVNVTFFTDVPTHRIKKLAKRLTKRITQVVHSHSHVKYGQLTHVINKTVYHKTLEYTITLPYTK